MDVQLYEHAIENHPLSLLLELKVLWLKSSQYYCHWIQKYKFFKHGEGAELEGGHWGEDPFLVVLVTHVKILGGRAA